MAKSKSSVKLTVAFLVSTIGRYSCKALSEVSPIDLSHDSVSRFLKSIKLSPAAILKKAKQELGHLDWRKGILIIDETTLDKSHSKKIELTGWNYSSSDKKAILSISLVTCILVVDGQIIPLSVRVHCKTEDGKTKNDHFKDIITTLVEQGIRPKIVVADSWFSSQENLKFLVKKGLIYAMPVHANRKISNMSNTQNFRAKELSLEEGPQMFYLRGVGPVLAFRLVSKDGTLKAKTWVTNAFKESLSDLRVYAETRWTIEEYHRELKQVCGISRCQARSGRAQRNYIVLSIFSWIEREKQRWLEQNSIYQGQWDVVSSAIATKTSINFNSFSARGTYP